MHITDLKYKSPNDTYTHNGIEYDLTHLRPHIITINDCKVRITFSHHVFSDSKIDGDIVKRGEQVRGFCIQRYKKSLQLKDILSKITPNHNFMKSRNNWFFIPIGLYHIYLNIKPDRYKRFDYVMRVTSAHMRKYRESGPAQAVKHILK